MFSISAGWLGFGSVTRAGHWGDLHFVSPDVWINVISAYGVFPAAHAWNSPPSFLPDWIFWNTNMTMLHSSVKLPNESLLLSSSPNLEQHGESWKIPFQRSLFNLIFHYGLPGTRHFSEIAHICIFVYLCSPFSGDILQDLLGYLQESLTSPPIAGLGVPFPYFLRTLPHTTYIDRNCLHFHALLELPCFSMLHILYTIWHIVECFLLW